MTLNVKRMKDISINNKTLLIREDLNVPFKDGVITNDKRIRAALPTIQYALEHNASIILMSHLGRPTEGEFNEDFSLKAVAEKISEYINQPVKLVSDWQQNGVDIKPGEVALLENVRFNLGEKKNDDTLAKAMAELCDIFVMDAFGTAHRAQASTHGVAKYAPVACAGPLLVNELEALAQITTAPEKPLIGIVGGSKVSTKLTVLKSLSDVVDQLIVGGGIANTFIAAAGYNVGKSLYEPDLLDDAKQLIIKAKESGSEIPIPVDVITAKTFSEDAQADTKLVSDVEDDDLILDIGPETAKIYHDIIISAKTIMWNGPVGVFEIPAFAGGTKSMALSIANSEGFSVAGGGDTLAAIDQFEIAEQVSYISTGGGAFLEFLEGKKLPALDILEQRT